MQPKTQLKVLLRPIVPPKTPYKITVNLIEHFMQMHAQKITGVLYGGWIRKSKTVNGPKKLRFVFAVGTTSKEARERFKLSQEWGVEVWDLADCLTH